MKMLTTKRLAVISILAVSECLMPVCAAESVALEPLPSSIGGNEIFTLGTGMVLVIGAILLCAWVYSRSQGLKGGAGEVFSILASQALGPKERILLVEVADKQLVIGMTATQVQTLHVFDQPVVDDAKPSNPVRFADRLKSVLGAARK